MKPIPKRLLIHSVTAAAKTNEDKWGTKTLNSPVTLSYVRVDPSRSLVTSKDNRQLQLSAVLFYDCKNSIPKSHSFELEDVITFGERTYTVKSVEPLYDGEKLHHYEIGLM